MALATSSVCRDLFGLGLSALIMVSYFHRRLNHPVAWLVLLWCRRICLALGGLCFLEIYGPPTAPRPLIFSTLLVAIFLIESFLLWRHIGRLDPQTMGPLMPVVPLQDENLWPNSPHWTGLQSRFQKRGFLFQSVVIRMAEGTVRSLILLFQSTQLQARLAIQFSIDGTPAGDGSMAFISHSLSGKTIITTNFRDPFAGFYPDRWALWRSPLRQNFEALLGIHQRRTAGVALLDPSDDPIRSIRQAMEELLRKNFDAGFLVLDADGRTVLSNVARYRLWKEALLLRHFGRALPQ